MRPEIPPLFRSNSQFIADIIERSWHDKPKERPSFSDIVRYLNKALVSTILQDSDAVEMWRANFKDKLKGIPLHAFYDALWRGCALDFPDESDTVGQVMQKCLEAVVGPLDKTIDIERFGLILHWYGPMCPLQSRDNLIGKVASLLQEPWFHGELTRKEAENILVTENIDKLKRDFLIRTSTHPTAPFAMTRIESVQKKNIEFAHHRISYDRNTGEYCMQFETREGLREIRGDTLAEFVRNAKMVLRLKKHVVCRKFDHIFVQQQIQGEYKVAVSYSEQKKKK